MTRIPVATIALFVSLLPQGPEEMRLLEPNKPVDRSIAGSERHTYKLTLRAGEFALVTAEQRGIDVVVRLSDAAGKPVIDAQEEFRNTGEEHASIVADAASTYTFDVQPYLKNAPPGQYTIRITAPRAATADDRAMQEAWMLHSAGARLQIAGKSEDALRPLTRAVAIAEAAKGADDIAVARIVSLLADVQLDLRHYAEAESLFQRAIAVMERVLGSEDPTTVLASSRLGALYERMGQRLKAEKLLPSTLAVIEKTFGPNHPLVARCLVPLGNLRYSFGDLEQAEAVERRALAIVEATTGTETLQYGALLNNLGQIFLDKQDYSRADEMFQRALSIIELFGRDSVMVATELNNLGITARQRKEYDRAENYYLRALAIREKTVGPDHPDIASILNNLAGVYNSKGDVAHALETHFRALQIREKSTGPYSGATLNSVGNIARTYAGAGDVVRALEFQRRADALLEAQLVFNLAIGSERQKLAFADTVSERTDRTISLNLNAAPTDAAASALAALVLLQRKGRVLDAMTDTLGTLRERAGNTADRELLDQLKATTAQLARLALNPPENMPAAERQQAMKGLEAKKESVETAISERSAEFRAASRPVTLEAVQAVIPGDSALVEFAVFHPFDPKAHSNSEAYGTPHYVAYIMDSRRVPRGIDLGPAAPIEAAVESFRGALRDPKRADTARLARAVDERVMQPIRETLGTATRLLISPDGDLNLIPFEALVDAQGKFAVERYSISYVSSGRDLLRMQVPRASRSGPVVVADPFFGDPDSPAGEKLHRSGRIEQRRSVTSGTGLSGLYFAPLAGTAQEARAIQALFPEATLLTRRDASKSALARMNAPRILHIASHGFFVQTADDGAAAGARASGSSPSTTIANPLLRSGLALAGANVDKGASVLTALEASNLNLWGTKLVTLSACDTGVGEVRNGEGVYGLRRSFFLAGAETLVMSLWPVSDYVTREMMTAYYTGLKNGQGRGEALRRAQLGMLARQNRRHPFYWASFIQAGDWRTLDGR